jgi:hypothetical protein
VFTLVHVVSASPTSTDIREVLLRICRELKDRFPFIEWDLVRVLPLCRGLQPPPPRTLLRPIAPSPHRSLDHPPPGFPGAQEENEDYQQVKDAFFKTLERAGECALAEKTHILLIIDAVNQLNPFYNAQTMDWFPTYL